MALWFMGLVGGLVIWVVNASDTGCWEWLWTPPTTTYASWIVYWCDGEIPIITIYWDNWSWKSFWITIKAMNEWTWTVTIWSLNDTGAYWSLYQWWNNYPFPNSDWPKRISNSGSTTVDASSYIPWSYSGETWIKQLKWDSSDNRNLWWGSWDYWAHNNWIYNWWFRWYDTWSFVVTNPMSRQAMCPDGYHIPSEWEWNALVYLWWKNYDANRWTSLFDSWSLNSLGYKYSFSWNNLSDDMQIPFVSSRDADSVTYASMDYGYYWSSSPRDSDDRAYYLYIGSRNLEVNDDYYRGYGYAIRCFKNEYVKPPVNKDIVIEATATDANQTLKINKYFANDYTVDRWDGTSDDLIDDIVHTYDEASGYTITLSLSWTDRWIFQGKNKPLVPTAETTITWVKIVAMPSLAEWFGESAAVPGNNFFRAFNHQWALVSLSTWSFDTSSIEVPWNGFFQGFNYEWMLKTLPDWSFNISNIETVGDYFFQSFNVSWALIGLPDGSFDTSNIKTVWDAFFNTFNRNGSLISLPTWSFNISNITWDVGKFFFCAFNREWELTSLPNDSFDTSNIKSAGDYFFNNFNDYWWITSLPSWSFNIFNIESVWSGFFQGFNYEWKISGIPSWAFKFSSWLNTVWNDFFYQFNQRWKIASLPDDSFNTSNIVSVWNGFFQWFNCEWLIASLPNNSFNTSNIKTVGESFFRSFNDYWALTSLPDGSFDLSWITDAGANFFRFFNGDWKLTTLPDSFTMSSVWASASYWYRNAFNSPDYTLNKNVLDLVTWITNPSNDRNTFSDNQPWRCGVHPNWLVNPANACNVKYDANGWSGTTTWWYISNATWVEVWSWITLPTREWYTLHGWQDASWNIVDEVIFPDMDGQTLYANWMPIEYEINYELNDGIISWENITWYTIESGDITLINPTKTWYTFTWRSGTELNSLTTSVTIPTWSTWDREYEANWQINQYIITFKDWDNEITSITADYWTWITPPANPTKNGYTFKWWEPEVPATMPAEDIAISAKWERNWSSGWWGGWGWWGGSSSKTGTGSTSSQTWNQINSNTWDIASTWTNVKEPETNTGSNAQTWSQADSSEQTTQNDESNTQDSLDNSSEWHTYTQEFQEAYEFAKWNWITTMSTIQKANMEWKLTRIAMAKMLSQYAINVLWKTPDTTQNNKFNDVTDKLDSDYDDWVTLAYQLGIMWQNMPWNNFRPNDEVTRAEFATALSRMAYWTSDWEYKATSKYYVHHMEKLVKEWIITNDDPNMKELRWYVMIMLMRSTENK